MTHTTEDSTFSNQIPRGSKVTKLPGGNDIMMKLDKLTYFSNGKTGTTMKDKEDWKTYWNQCVTICGDKSFLWWRNKIRHKFPIKDGCPTVTSQYIALLKENCKGYWELYSYDAQDRVSVGFSNEADAIYFKMLWC